jgi:hypothetical protein
MISISYAKALDFDWRENKPKSRSRYPRLRKSAHREIRVVLHDAPISRTFDTKTDYQQLPTRRP